MKIKKIILLFWLVIFSVPLNANEPVKSLAFKAVHISQAQIQNICQQLNPACKSEEVIVWSVQMGTNKYYYLIDQKLRIAQLSKKQGEYRIDDHWNLAKYQKAHAVEEGEITTEFIHPALYPLNRNNHAVALVSSFSASYSGGGRGEQTAQFIQLLPQRKTYQVLKDIPFYYYERIKACFSEQDYKKYTHCHDEQSTLLSITYEDIGKPFYQWNLIYSEIDWPAHTNRKRVQKRIVTVIPSP